MKKNILVGLCIAGFFQFSVFGQKCKYFREGKDEFSGETFKESKDVLAPGISFYLKKVGSSKLSSVMDIVIPYSAQYTITPKDTVYFKLEDGGVVKITPDKDYQPKKNVSSYGVVTAYSPFYLITREDIQRMASSPIIKVRITFEKPVDFSPKKGEVKDIMKAAACMLAD